MRRGASFAVSIAVGVALGLGALAIAEPYVPTSPTVRGLRVGGELAPRDRHLSGWLAERQRDFKATEVTLRHGEHRFRATLGELGAAIDVAAVLAEAHAAGHRGSLVRRLREAGRARRGELDVPLKYVLDERTAAAYIERFADELSREPVSAQLDLARHAKVPDVPGRRLDVEASVRHIAESFATARELDLVAREIPAEVTLDDLNHIDLAKALASSESRFSPYKIGRSANVELAARKLNGLVLRPGQAMSFNERVGPRTRDAGFKEAPEIVGDELTVGIGGGVCQVSSTLHAAAIYGGLEVVQRKSHSRPSDYTLLGLDATVAYPSVDLKIRNPYDFTVVIHAFVPEPGKLRVELLGGDEVQDVRYTYGVSGIEPFTRRIVEKGYLAEGRAFRKQKGTRGMDVHSHVTIRFRNGRVEKRTYYSGYRATPEIYWVAPGYDRGELPELPKHAKGVEDEIATQERDIYDDLSG